MEELQQTNEELRIEIEDHLNSIEALKSDHEQDISIWKSKFIEVFPYSQVKQELPRSLRKTHLHLSRTGRCKKKIRRTRWRSEWKQGN